MEKSMKNKIKMQQFNGHGIVKELNGYDGVIQYNSLKKKDDFIYISNDSKMEKGIKVGDSVFFEIRYTQSPKHPTLVWADNIEKDYSQKGHDMKRRVNPTSPREVKDMLIVLNSQGNSFEKYPFGNKELTLKVKDLEAKGLIEFDKYVGRWVKRNGARKSNPRNAGFDWLSNKTKKDLLDFFKKKLPSLSAKQIKEEIEETLDNGVGRYSSDGGASVTIDGEEFNLIEDHDKFHDLAINIVTQMLDDEPENFNQSFIQNHIYITDTDKSVIAGEEADNYYDDMKDREIEKEYERKNGEIIGEEDEPDYDAMREELKSDYSDNIEKELDDPIGYFVDQQGIYTLEELLKSSFIRIDTDERRL
jgi:hypothetical protein